MIYSVDFRVSSHECDAEENVKPSAVLRYMQEAANLQLFTYGPSYEDLHKSGKAFILSRINMSIYSPLHAYDNIKAETWGCESKGVSFTRCGRIYKGDSLVSELISVWALVDTESGKFCRVSDVKFGFECDGEVIDLDTPTRIKIPEEVNMGLVGEYNVRYSDCDINYHMNNTNYLDMYSNFLPPKDRQKIANISVSYQSEAKIDSVLKVYRGEYDGTYYFRTTTFDGKINSEAVITTD